ncbi:hypothetical protein [Alteraurantiacibacter aquimixticola]|uniref:Surface antigen domain-containing protein n=1 Tax=Alteraurantiacibacter aquimixticola TaxID=2489173 RepID=A0A4T3EX12_9SPHN|nr:hypothetical protein [Alteraurantiacibacter aquimixticola]TIX49106.1 hypothetical protein E5222_15395 [Alteraurantiacibacter aquimixticola]
MTRASALALAALVLASCTARETVQTGFVPAAAFAPLAAPGEAFADGDAVIAHYLAGTGRNSPSEREVSDYPGARGSQMLLFSAEGLEDDSVRAMQWRVVIEEAAGGYRVTEAGLRQRCYRSGNDQWTTALCP